MTSVRCVALCSLLLGTGCALTSKGDTLDPHFFTPEPATPAVAAARAADPSQTPRPLRLGRVRATVDIKEKIIYRASTYEVGYYEELRWTERPDAYLRRALAHALFEEGGFTQAMLGGGPTLDAELFSFEEIRGPNPVARVALTFVLRDDDHAMVEETLSVDEPVVVEKGDAPATPLIRAFSRALAKAVARTVARTVARAARVTEPAAPAKSVAGP